MPLSVSQAITADKDEAVKLSGIELSNLIHGRKISCVEVMISYLNHIERINPQYNAIVSLRARDELLKEAKQCDSELLKGQSRGWMHGFPHAVKDLTDVKGLLTSMGSPIFKDNIAKKDSILTERIRNAGAIIIGKTNVPEFGLGSHTYNPVFGPTLNAYDGKSSAGGSSGGAAAALALQMVVVADGSDLMGSLRNPAAFNNVIGFRPTPGLVPLSDSFKEELPCNGPMGRNVSDTAMLLSTLAGHHPASPSSLNSKPAEFAQPLQKDFKGVKIGWLGDFDGYLSMDKGLLPLCEKALQGFRDVGGVVDPVILDYPMEELWQTWLTFRHWLVRSRALPLYENPKTRALLKPEAIWEIEGGANMQADAISKASASRARWYAALLKAFQTYDYLVLPTAQVFPFDANIHWPKEINGRPMDTYHRWMEVVIPGTLSGCPVANVPAGFGTNGLPMGLQIIGKRYADFATLQMAYAYEQATRWNLDRHPSVLS
ncbi:MAG: amidase [Gammaproteobacteria bacterium]|nr:amidase [Gammaproteobacteria bacterium]